MGFWLPQTIQKRLLLHVLQQISILSNVDISNLHVSLGSSSQFSFDDLNLAVDEIKIPHFALRSGTVKHLELQLTVSGGVSICGREVLFVLKPLVEDQNHEVNTFSLVKSIHDLTNSMMQYSDPDSHSTNIDNQAESDVSVSSLGKNGRNDSDKIREGETYSVPGTFENMKNKILNVALSKLMICFENIKFRFLLDFNHIVELQFGRVELKTESDNSRSVFINDFYMQHTQPKQSEDTDSLSDELMTNSILYSSKEATSIYMSAIESLDKDSQAGRVLEENDNANSNNLIIIHSMNISFQGLSSFDDLSIDGFKVKVRNIEVNIKNILTLSNSIPGFILTGLKNARNRQSHQVPTSKGYRRFQKEQDILEGLHSLALDIDYINLNLGEGISLNIENISYTLWENNEQTLTVGDIRSSGDGISLECLNSPIIRAVNRENKINIDVFHEIHLKLSRSAIMRLWAIQISIQECLFVLQKKFPRNANKYPQNDWQEHLIFHSRPLNLVLDMENYSLFFSTNEIESSFPHDILKTEKVRIGKYTDSSEDLILELDDLSIVKSKSRIQLNSFDENFNPSSLVTKFLIKVKKIRVKHNFEFITQLNSDFESMCSSSSKENNDLQNEKQKSGLKRNLRVLQSSGIIYKQAERASYAIMVDRIHVTVESVFKDNCGDIQAKVSSLLFIANIDGTFSTLCSDILVQRVFSGQKQVFASAIRMEDDKKPILFLQKRTTGKIRVIIQGMSFDYYATWLDIFKNGDTTENPKSDENKPESSIIWEIKLLDSAIKIHPYRINPCLVIVLDHLVCNGKSMGFDSRLSLKVGTLLLIDDVKNIKVVEKKHYPTLVSFFAHQGFSGVGKLETVSVQVKKIKGTIILAIKAINIGLSLCADSTYTLIQLCMDLKIPLTFPDDEKYSFTIPFPIDIFKDIDEDYFCSSHIKKDLDYHNNEDDDLVPIYSKFWDESNIEERYTDKDYSLIETSSESAANSNIRLQESYLDRPNKVNGELASEVREEIDIKIELEVTKTLIKLFDGYDWKFTRKSITRKIDELDRQLKNIEANSHLREKLEFTVFDSIYISGNPLDSADLRKRVNDEIQGDSIPGASVKKADLHPSRHYKALIELNQLFFLFKGHSLKDTLRLQSDGSAKMLSNCEMSVQSFDVIDNVPTSTWNKLLTLLRHEQWPMDKPMLHLEICMFRPFDYLAATELKIAIELAPLRLHVDQDTLDFIVKFGEFKDERFDLIDEYPDIPFIQKLTTNSVKLKLDYKPKKVDYSGLRSGHTSELMNFFILDGANITLKGVSLYGISGFSELNSILKSVWTPDITSRQLPGVLKGFAPVKSILALGTGAKALVSVPFNEYKQDRRVGRSLKQGCNVFVRTATGDFVKLGARLASGTQAFLENTEELLGGNGSQGRVYKPLDPLMDINGLLREDQLVGGSNPRIKGHKPAALVIDPSKCDEGEPKIVSLYADQPLDLHQGLEEAYTSLEKHMHLVYDVIWKTKGEILESNSGTAAAAVSVAKVAPVAVIRPLIGATEAISKALQGISNQLDKEQVNDINDKYKSRACKE